MVTKTDFSLAVRTYFILLLVRCDFFALPVSNTWICIMIYMQRCTWLKARAPKARRCNWGKIEKSQSPSWGWNGWKDQMPTALLRGRRKAPAAPPAPRRAAPGAERGPGRAGPRRAGGGGGGAGVLRAAEPCRSWSWKPTCRPGGCRRGWPRSCAPPPPTSWANRRR